MLSPRYMCLITQNLGLAVSESKSKKETKKERKKERKNTFQLVFFLFLIISDRK